MKNKLLTILAIIILGLILVLNINRQNNAAPNQSAAQNPSSIKSDSPQIISTVPDPLDNSIVPADQIIQITFNKPLQNAPEFKTRIEPKIDYKIELSSDRKTAKIVPAKPYDLGATYTFFISPESKFDGGGSLDGGKVFHFRTVKYTGV